MPDVHSNLPPSASKMWISCPPSAALNAKAPDSDSSYALAGTLAHSIGEAKIRQALGEDISIPECTDAEMAEATDQYRDYVLEQIEAARASCRDPTVLVEQRVSCERWAEGCFGTADFLLISDQTLHICDLKYGQLEVSAQDNTQLMCYSLGAIDAFASLYEFTEVKMTIFQPRLNHCDTCTKTVEELLQWGDTVLKPAAVLALAGEGAFCAGEHCRFCKVKQTCRKRAEYNLALARYDFAMPPELTDDEIEAILAKADDLTSWISDIKDYAMQQALSGQHWSQWKLVEGRSVRTYTDEAAVADAVTAAGFDPYEHKGLGLTAMTKLLGKRKFEELLGGLIHKPPGKPTLVPISDRRAEWNTAKNDFMED